MSLEGFQLIDNEPIDKSIIKIDFSKVFHQHGANLNESDQNVGFISSENNIYHQIGNAYLKLDTSVRKFAAIFENNSEIRLFNIASAYCFKEAVLSTTGGSDLEHNKSAGQVSTTMRSETSKDGDLLSHFDKFNDGDTKASINNTSLKELLIDNHLVVANKGKVKGQLSLEDIIGFCKSFKKITENLGFHLTFKRNDLQKVFFTTIATDINVTINSLYLFAPILIPNSQTQVLFNESIKSNYTITYVSLHTERKLSTDGSELQVDIVSAEHINSPKCLIRAFQTETRIGTPNKKMI